MDRLRILTSFALFLLLLPDASAARWFGKVLNSILTPSRFEPGVWKPAQVSVSLCWGYCSPSLRQAFTDGNISKRVRENSTLRTAAVKTEHQGS